MRNLLTILFVCLLQNSFATNYYVSGLGGDANNGTSTSTPWQTLNKVNSFTFSAGDSIFFRRSEGWTGVLRIKQSGSAGHPIYVGAYGEGANPIVTGMQPVDYGWTNLGGNIWESSSPVSSLSYCNVVTINGVNTAMGRYPNTGYLAYQSHSGNTSITSSSLTGTPDWTGADVAIRTDRSTIQRRNITSQSGSTLNFVAMDWGGTDGFGFFIENDARTLDVQNEWYYNLSTKKIQIYSIASPTDVQVAIIDTLINLGASKYITIDGLDIIGANKYLLYSSNSNNISVTNCNLSFSGDWSIAIYGGSYNKILNNTITDASDGMYLSRKGDGLPCYDTISNNVIKRTNIIPGVVPNSNGSGAIRYYSDNSVIQYNDIDSSGYNGIFIKYANVQVRNNLIKNSCLVIDDGGAIYTGFAGNTGKVIDGNIIINSVGNYNGTNNTVLSGNGIYIDDNGNHTTVTNNSVTNSGGSGLFLHGANNITVRNNTFYNNGTGGYNKGGLFMQESSLDSNMVNNTITNNIFLNPNSSQVIAFLDSYRGVTALKGMATMDSNYYCIPISGDANIMTIYNSDNSTYPYYNLAGWKTFFGQDANSKGSPKSVSSTDSLRFEYNATTSSKTISLDANYIDVKGNVYNGSITLAPYSSAILIKTDAPVVDAGDNQHIIIYGNLKLINE